MSAEHPNAKRAAELGACDVGALVERIIRLEQALTLAVPDLIHGAAAVSHSDPASAEQMRRRLAIIRRVMDEEVT